MTGPLKGTTIIEFSGIGPGPFCGMVLADLGAEVIKIDRASSLGKGNELDFQSRSKYSITADLKKPDAIDEIKKLLSQADALFEGFRPGVMERLGLGPEEVLDINPNIVYGRMTGWGQTGPLANSAGHDLNYIALTGALDSIGRKGENPPPPLNLIGDYGGGGMFLALGILAGILNVKNGGKGQVVDAAMVDGASLLMTMFYSFDASGFWKQSKESNLLDGGAHFYDTFECKDGKHMSVGSIEPQFYEILIDKLELDKDYFGNQMDQSKWFEYKEVIKDRFKTKTRDEWAKIFEGTDGCVAPVLSIAEAPHHHHLKDRNTFIELDGRFQPAPAPRFSLTKESVKHGPPKCGQDNATISKKFKLDESKLS